MQSPGKPANESDRLAELKSYEILDSAPDELLDLLTRLATVIFGVPIALVSLVDAQRQWFKSRQGLNATETPRDISFCGHAVASGTALIIPDARNDERFFDNPLVVGEPEIRFYAGVPLRNPRGFDLGTFCIIDQKPRELSNAETAQLALMAQLAMLHIEILGKLTITKWVVDAVPGMLAYWDHNQRCRFANAAYERWFGIRPEQLLGRTLSELLGPIYELNRPYILGALRGEEQLFEREIPDPNDGTVRYSQAHYVPRLFEEMVHGFAVMVTDISTQKRLQAELREAKSQAERFARHDGLTQLPNRVNIQEQLERLLELTRRYGRKFAILYLDLDGFKAVNDTMGHAAGDAVLVEVARRLVGAIRKSDVVGRLGGDEFIVVLPQIDDEEQVAVVAAKLLHVMATPPIEVAGQPTGVTTSIGAAIYPMNGLSLTSLMTNADAALYNSKRLGKNRFSFYVAGE